MFAEDVDLIPAKAFSDLLQKLRGHPEHAQPALKSLWETMNAGGFSTVLMADLKRFNGGLSEVQLSLLILAAQHDWREVEPAIFGTLLERALDKRQRHKLGAHYTPRAYVERLVTPVVMELLRADWVPRGLRAFERSHRRVRLCACRTSSHSRPAPLACPQSCVQPLRRTSPRAKR